MKIETGVMIVKYGKAWGITYQDGQSTSYGWTAPEDALIYNPESCRQPEDVTYRGSPYIEELRTGTLVYVERRTEVILSLLTCLNTL